MRKSNSKAETFNLDGEFRKIMSEAKLSHQRSRDGAMEAAASAFMLWLATLGPSAKKSSGEWLEKEIQSANEKIAAHNQEIIDLRKRAKAFHNGKLPDDDPLNEEPRDAQHAEDMEAVKTELRRVHQFSKQMWASRRLMKIEAKEGANGFTRLVKFVFEFDQSKHSDLVARYALALEWIASKFSQEPPQDRDQVLAALKGAGGFEDVIHTQRQVKAGISETADDRKAINDAIRNDIKHELTKRTPIASIPLEARHDQDGFVVVLGRKAGGAVDLIGEVKLTENEMQSVISSIGVGIDIPNASSSEFVARVLDLGRMVSEGQETKISRDGTATGAKLKVQRVLAYRPGENSQAEFVVSARATDASPIVYAWPNDAAVLGIPQKPMMMNDQTRRRIEHLVRDQNVRRYITIQAEHAPTRADGTPAESPMAWLSGNDVLMARSSKNANQKFFWSDLGNVDYKPLDLDNFQPQFHAAIDDVELDRLYMERLKAWGESKSPVKQQITATLKFNQGELHVLIKDHERLDFKLSSPVMGRFTMSFRMRDLHDLVQSLLKQRGAGTFELSGDEGGLLEVAWSDGLGRYAIYLPTVGTDGRLQSRRMSPMRITAPTAIAAE